MLKLVIGAADSRDLVSKCRVWMTQRMPRMLLTGCAGSTEDVLKLAFDSGKDSRFIFLLSQDIKTGEMSLFDLSTRLRAAFSDCYILYLHDDDGFLRQAVNANIMPSGFMASPYREEELLLLLVNVYGQSVKSQNRRMISAYARGIYNNLMYDDILYAEAVQKTIRIVTLGGCVEYADTLRDLERKLDQSFLRCHNNYIINTRKIQRVDLKDGQIRLISDASIPISGQYRDRVERYLHRALPRAEPRVRAGRDA